jgi:membrane associated rhomboid family serine protease
MRLPPARATSALLGLTVAAWVLAIVTGVGDYAAIAGGFIAARLGGSLELAGAVPVWLTPLTATLIHAGAIHLIFNMVMLGYCGRFSEIVLGRKGLLALYVAGAYAAAFAQYLADPLDRTPMVGASGAVSAVLGAYALLYGRQRAAVGHAGLNSLLHVAWLAAAWIGLQLLIGFASAGSGMTIAIAAHIGGFLAGLALTRPLLDWRFRDA